MPTLQTQFYAFTPSAVIVPKGETKEVVVRFSAAVELVEAQFSAGLTLKEVRITAGPSSEAKFADKSFTGSSYKKEVVPPNFKLVCAFENAGQEEIVLRGGFYVDEQVPAEVSDASKVQRQPLDTPADYKPAANGAPNGPQAPMSGAQAVPVPQAPAAQAAQMQVPMQTFQAPQAATPFQPPPPGGVAHHQVGDQQITVTTPAAGAPIPGVNAQGGYGAQPTPGYSSFQLGNQHIQVSNPGVPQAPPHPTATEHSPGVYTPQPSPAHTQMQQPIVAPRMPEGPRTVTCGMDEIPILLKASEALVLLQMLKGHIHHPAFSTPVVGAVERSLAPYGVFA